jgi:hypothetical protein
VYYYRGGHGAALAPENLPCLASYVMDGVNSKPVGLSRERSASFALLSRASPLLSWLLVVALLAGFSAFVALGPWSRLVNLFAVLAALLALFVVLDLA